MHVFVRSAMLLYKGITAIDSYIEGNRILYRADR